MLRSTLAKQCGALAVVLTLTACGGATSPTRKCLRRRACEHAFSHDDLGVGRDPTISRDDGGTNNGRLGACQLDVHLGRLRRAT